MKVVCVSKFGGIHSIFTIDPRVERQDESRKCRNPRPEVQESCRNASGDARSRVAANFDGGQPCVAGLVTSEPGPGTCSRSRGCRRRLVIRRRRLNPPAVTTVKVPAG